MEKQTNTDKVRKESQVTRPRGAIRLHYRDVCCLLKFIDSVVTDEWNEDQGFIQHNEIPIDERSLVYAQQLLPEELHAYERLKDMKVQMEDFFRWQSEGQKGKDK